MVKIHSDSEETCCCDYLDYSFQLAARVLLYVPSHGQDSTRAFVTPVIEHWLEWEIAQWVHREGLIWQPVPPWADTLHRAILHSKKKKMMMMEQEEDGKTEKYPYLQHTMHIHLLHILFYTDMNMIQVRSYNWHRHDRVVCPLCIHWYLETKSSKNNDSTIKTSNLIRWTT